MRMINSQQVLDIYYTHTANVPETISMHMDREYSHENRTSCQNFTGHIPRLSWIRETHEDRVMSVVLEVPRHHFLPRE